jgi:hypothetical protein
VKDHSLDWMMMGGSPSSSITVSELSFFDQETFRIEQPGFDEKGGKVNKSSVDRIRLLEQDSDNLLSLSLSL